MNKRIEQLAEQANLHDGWFCGQGNIEKFAELIVRECGVALSPMMRDMISRGKAYDLIKQHFGVEE
jgi:hypothetical protein